MLTGIRIILPLLLAVLIMACSSSVGQPATPPPATAVPEVSPTIEADEATLSEASGSYADFQCNAETPPLFANAEWTEYQPIHRTSIQLPSDRWEPGYEEPGFAVYFLPAVDASGNQWSAALTFYVYSKGYVREKLGLTWDEFVQANIDAIADDGDAVPNFRLVRQWDVEPKPKPLPPRSIGERPSIPPITIRDHRSEFRYNGVGVNNAEVEGYGMSKWIGPYHYFIRLDICAYNRGPDREGTVAKMFDSLANGNYGHYW